MGCSGSKGAALEVVCFAITLLKQHPPHRCTRDSLQHQRKRRICEQLAAHLSTRGPLLRRA